MKKSIFLAIFILIAMLGTTIAVRDAWALDAPHNTNKPSWSITCSRCHYNPSSTPTWASLPTGTDTTFKNNLCTSCHSASGMPLADPRFTDIKTHSSEAVGSTQYGNWTNECTICHSPHNQQQATNAANSGETGVNVVIGTTTTISSAPSATMSTLTDTTKSFGVNAYVGYLLMPNVNYPTRVFRISANTATTFTVDGAINLSYAAVGNTYAVRYGKMVTAYVGPYTVKFFGDNGANSYATSSVPGSISSICQVCHTQTHSYRNDATMNDAVQHNDDPDQRPGGRCGNCHGHHNGFKSPVAGCTDCHGNPPSQNVAGYNGVVGSTPTNTVYLTTGATLSAGAHVRHANTLGMACKTCHSNSIMPTVDKQIRMGFAVNGTNYSNWSGGVVSSGSISVFNALTNGYTWTGAPGTTLNSSTSKNYNCTVYCHGTTISSGTNKNPSFMGGASQVACGTCHGASTGSYPATGGHARHASTAAGSLGLACSNCHGAYTPQHVNGSVNWNLNTGNSLYGASAKYAGAASGATGALAPSGSYQTCSTIYCHSAGQSSTGGAVPASYGTPTWSNTALNCGGCHMNMTATGTPGSHAAHAVTMNYACSVCHNGYTSTSVSATQHVNGTINTGFTGTGAATVYTQANTAAGNGYGSCSATTCHGGTSITWGADTSDDRCVKCHGVSGSSQAAYSANNNLSAPGYNTTGRDAANQTGTVTSFVSNDAQVGAHDVHLRGLGSYATGAAVSVCSDCHTLYSSPAVSVHMNGGTANMVWSAKSRTAGMTPSYAGTVCSNVYCHNGGFTDVATRGTNTRPTWTDGTYLANAAGVKNSTDCNKCHLSPPVGAAKYDHSGKNISTPCTPCHGHEGSGATHIDGTFYGVGGGGCNACHSYDTVAGTWGAGSGSGLTGNATAWGAHAKHIDHLKLRTGTTLSAATDTFGGANFNAVCGFCHTQNMSADHGPDGGVTTRKINFNGSAAHTFGTGPTPTFATVARSCSILDCHFKATPAW